MEPKSEQKGGVSDSKSEYAAPIAAYPPALQPAKKILLVSKPKTVAFS